MHWLKTQVAEIERLADTDDPALLTYSVLRCRLALEKVAYDRLKAVHTHLSPRDLKRWQPRDVIRQLIEDVDPSIATGQIWSIAPLRGDETDEEIKALNHVEIGRQAGFDVKLLGKIWNSLGSFLHVRLPSHSDDDPPLFGEKEAIRDKVAEALEFLHGVSRGTLLTTGWGEVASFTCGCGTENKRRADLLRDLQIISCYNRECVHRFTVTRRGEDIFFELRAITLKCEDCGSENRFSEGPLLDIPLNQFLGADCACGAKTLFAWRLHRATLPQDGALR